MNNHQLHKKWELKTLVGALLGDVVLISKTFAQKKKWEQHKCPDITWQSSTRSYCLSPSSFHIFGSPSISSADAYRGDLKDSFCAHEVKQLLIIPIACQWWWQRTKASCVANSQTYLKGIGGAYCVSYNCQTMSKVHDAQHSRNVFLAKPCTHWFFCTFTCGFGVCPSAQRCHCALRLTRRNKLFSMDGHQSFWYPVISQRAPCDQIVTDGL